MAAEKELTIVIRAREQTAQVLATVLRQIEGVKVQVKDLDAALNRLGGSGGGFTKSQAGAIALSSRLYLIQKGLHVIAEGFESTFGELFEKAEKFTVLSRQFGLPIETFSKLDFAARVSGSSIEGLSIGLRSFAITLGKALEGNDELVSAFKAIGLGAKDIRKLAEGDLVDAFIKVTHGVAGIDNALERTAVGFRLFRRGVKDAITVGLEGDLNKIIARFVALGAVLDEDTAKKLKAIKDLRFAELRAALEGLVLSILKSNGGLDALAELLDKVIDGIVGLVKEHPVLIQLLGFLFASVIKLISAWVDLVAANFHAADSLTLVEAVIRVLATSTEALRSLLLAMALVWTELAIVIYGARAAYDRWRDGIGGKAELDAREHVADLTSEYVRLSGQYGEASKNVHDLIFGTNETAKAQDKGKSAAQSLADVLKKLGYNLDTSGALGRQAAKATADLAAQYADLRAKAVETTRAIAAFQSLGPTSTSADVQRVEEELKLQNEITAHQLAAEREIDRLRAQRVLKGVGLEQSNVAVQAVRDVQAQADANSRLEVAERRVRREAEFFATTYHDDVVQLLHDTAQLSDVDVDVSKALERAAKADIVDPAKLARVRELAIQLHFAAKEAEGFADALDLGESVFKDFYAKLTQGGKFKDNLRAALADVPKEIGSFFEEGFIRAFRAKSGFDKKFEINIFTLMKNLGQVLTGERGPGAVFDNVFRDASDTVHDHANDIIKEYARIQSGAKTAATAPAGAATVAGASALGAPTGAFTPALVPVTKDAARQSFAEWVNAADAAATDVEHATARVPAAVAASTQKATVAVGQLAPAISRVDAVAMKSAEDLAKTTATVTTTTANQANAALTTVTQTSTQALSQNAQALSSFTETTTSAVDATSQSVANLTSTTSTVGTTTSTALQSIADHAVGAQNAVAANVTSTVTSVGTTAEQSARVTASSLTQTTTSAQQAVENITTTTATATQQMVEQTTTAVSKLPAVVSDATAAGAANATKAVQGVATATADAATAGADASVAAAQTVTNAQAAAAATGVNAAGAVAGANVQAAQVSQSAWGSFFQFFLQIATTVISSILSLFTTLISTVVKLLGGLGDLVSGVFTGIGNLLSGAGGGGTSGGTGSAFGGVVNFVQNIFGTGGLIAKGFDVVAGLFGNAGFFGTIKAGASAIFGTDGVIGTYWTKVKDYFSSGPLGSVFSKLGPLVGVIGGGFAVFQGVMTLFSKRATGLQRALGGGEAILGLATAFRSLQVLLPQFANVVQSVVSASLVAQGVSAPLPGALGAGGSIGITQFIGAAFSKAGFGALTGSLSGLTDVLGHLVSPLTTLIENLVGALGKVLVHFLPQLAAVLSAQGGGTLAATLVTKLSGLLGAIALPVAVIGALYSIYQGVKGVVDNTAALKKVEKGDPAATRAGILQGVNLAIGVALGAVIGFLVGGPVGLFVGAAIGAAVATVVNAQITKILATVISQAQQGGLTPGASKERIRQGISQSELAEQIKSGVGNDALLIILGGPIHALLTALLSGLVTPDIEKIFDKIFAETISKASGKFKLQINRHLEHFLGEGVASGPRGRADVDLFRAPRFERGPDGERVQVRAAGSLRGEAYGAAALVSGLIGAGSENYERIHRFFLILANNLAQTRKPAAEIQQIIYQIVRGVTGNLLTGVAAVNVLFEHQQSAVEKAARAHKGLAELSKQEAQYARRTQAEIGLVADAYQGLIDKNTRAGATPVNIRQLAEANSRVTGGVKIKSFERDLRVSVLTAAAAGDLDLTKKLASKIGDTLVYAAAALADKVPKGVDAFAIALKVAQSGVKHQTDEFLKQVRIANLTAAAGGAEYTAKQARAAGDSLGFLAAKFKDLPAGVNAFAIALKVAQSDVKGQAKQAREFIKALQEASLQAAAGGAEYTALQAAKLGDLLGVLAGSLQKQVPTFNFFALAVDLAGKTLAKRLRQLAEVGAVQAELFSKALPLLTEAEALLLRIPRGTGGVGRRAQKDLLADVDARQAVQQFLAQVAAAAAGTGPREQFVEIERKRAAATAELPQDLTLLHKHEAVLAREEAASRAAIADGDQKAAEKAQKAADKTRKAVQEERKAVADLTQQALDAAKAWGDAVQSLVTSIRDLDKAARDFNLSMNEQIATLTKASDTASVYDGEITRQQGIINDTTQSAATRVQAVQDLAALYQRQAQAQISDIQRAADARKDALNKELDAIQPLAALADSIHKQLLDLKVATVGGGAGAGYEKIDFLQREIAKQRRLYQTTTGEEQGKAASSLQDLLQQLLQVGGDFFGTTSGQYQSLQQESVGLLTELGDRADAAAKRADQIQADIKQIDIDTQKAIDDVNTKLAGQLTTLRDTAVPLFQQQRDLLFTQLGEEFPGLTKEQLDTLITNPQALANAIATGIKSRLDDIYSVLSKRAGLGDGTHGAPTGHHPGVSTDDAGKATAHLVGGGNVAQGFVHDAKGAIGGKHETVPLQGVIDAAAGAVQAIVAEGPHALKIVYVKAAMEGDVRGLASQLKDPLGFTGVARVAQFLSDDIAAAFINTNEDVFSSDATVLADYFSRVKALERGGVAERVRPYLVGERGPELFVPQAASASQASDAVTAALDPRSTEVRIPSGKDPKIRWIGTDGPALFAPPVAGYVLDHERSMRLTGRADGGRVAYLTQGVMETRAAGGPVSREPMYDGNAALALGGPVGPADVSRIGDAIAGALRARSAGPLAADMARGRYVGLSLVPPAPRTGPYSAVGTTAATPAPAPAASPGIGKVEVKVGPIVLQIAKDEKPEKIRLYMRTAKDAAEEEFIQSAQHGALRRFLGKREVR